MKRILVLAILLGSTLIGCEGEIAIYSGLDGVGPKVIGPANNSNNTNQPDKNNANVDTCAQASTSLDDTPMRRLTAIEYNNSVRDLFPGVLLEKQVFSADEKIGNFPANILAPVSLLQGEEYQGAAENIAQTVVDNLETTLPGCRGLERTCVDTYIADLGRRAFRRALEPGEQARLKALFTFGQSEYDFETGIRLVIEAVLQSGSFIYRIEAGTTDTFSQIDPYALASRLSYFLWKSTPDTELLDLAESGDLANPEVLKAQARRLMQDPKAREVVNEVVMEWFELDSFEGIEKTDPDFNPETIQSMHNETLAFIDQVLWEDDGRINTLLTADYTFVDARTAALYGVAPPDGDGMVRVDLDTSKRRGILTQPLVLARHGVGQMPIYRGKFIRESLFCDGPPPPPNVLDNPPETFEGQSDRSKSDGRLAHPGCKGCHIPMDPIGLAFDNYDPMGRWRSQDQYGNDVYGDGALVGSGVDGEITGAPELIMRLAESEKVAECVSEQFFRYAFARSAGRADACTLVAMEDALNQSNGDIKEMLVAIVSTDAFRFRRNLSE